MQTPGSHPNRHPPQRAQAAPTPIGPARAPMAAEAARRPTTDGPASGADPRHPLRLFYAVGLDPASRAAAGAIQQDLRDAGIEARWIDPDDLHLTLRFLGACAPRLLPALQALLHAVAADHPPQTLSAGRIEHWGRLLVATFEPAPALTQVVDALERGARELGFPAEARAFRPHVTLARGMCGRAAGTPVQAAAPASWPLAIDHLTLYQSQPDRPPPRYRALERRAFGGRRP